MKNKTKLAPLAAGIKFALTGSALLMLSGTSFAAVAQDAAQAQKTEDVEKIVVVGSRGAPRSVGDSAVPVDVIGADEFVKAGPSDMMTLMSSAVPSFNVNTQPINDAST